MRPKDMEKPRFNYVDDFPSLNQNYNDFANLSSKGDAENYKEWNAV
jgi:hypothetical protein